MSPLRLLDHLEPGCVRIELAATDKASTLERMIDLALEEGLVGDRDALREALRRREEIVSTGIGRGIAIPHADLPEIESPRLLLGVFPDGVEFDALDEEPVHLVFLLLGTPRTPTLHMQILARIARLGKDPELREALCASTSPAEALSVLERVEARH